jgi:hypothetical protein
MKYKTEEEVIRRCKELNDKFARDTYCIFRKDMCRKDCVAFKSADYESGFVKHWVYKLPKCKMMKLPHKPNDSGFMEGAIVGGIVGSQL